MGSRLTMLVYRLARSSCSLVRMSRQHDTIEPFSEGHLRDCARMFAAVFRGRPWEEPWTAEAAEERLAQVSRTPGSFGLVAIRDGTPVGLVMGYRRRQAEGRVFVLEEMCVETGAQGTGVGTELLARLTADLAGEGVDRTILLTVGDTPAESFYAANGFRRSFRTVLIVGDRG